MTLFFSVLLVVCSCRQSRLSRVRAEVENKGKLYNLGSSNSLKSEAELLKLLEEIKDNYREADTLLLAASYYLSGDGSIRRARVLVYRAIPLVQKLLPNTYIGYAKNLDSYSYIKGFGYMEGAFYYPIEGKVDYEKASAGASL